MAQQILIIGLGRFGMSLAATLSERGVEVLAADRRSTLVEEAATFVTEAVIIYVAIDDNGKPRQLPERGPDFGQYW